VVINPFKDHIRNLYSEWHLSGNRSLTPSWENKKANVGHLCQWILRSWGRISPELVFFGFRKYFPSIVLNGNEEDVIWQDCREESSSEIESGNSNESDSDSIELKMIIIDFAA
jgi:hypothetical protein